MRLAIFSDIHGNLIAFEAILADLETIGEVDTIWCLGDLAAMGSRPSECIQKIQDLRESYGKEKFKVISGNTDRYFVTGERFPQRPAKDAEAYEKMVAGLTTMNSILSWNLSQLTWDNYEFLAKILRRELRQHVQGYGDVIGFHAIPGNDEAMVLRPDSDDEEARDALLDRAGRLAVCGHTHLVMDRDLGNWRVINPGSVGASLSQPGHAEWALLTFENGKANVDFRAIPYDVEAAIADLAATNCPQPEWLSSKLRPIT